MVAIFHIIFDFIFRSILIILLPNTQKWSRNEPENELKMARKWLLWTTLMTAEGICPERCTKLKNGCKICPDDTTWEPHWPWLDDCLCICWWTPRSSDRLRSFQALWSAGKEWSCGKVTFLVAQTSLDCYFTQRSSSMIPPISTSRELLSSRCDTFGGVTEMSRLWRIFVMHISHSA